MAEARGSVKIFLTGIARFSGVHTPLNRSIAAMRSTLNQPAKEGRRPRQVGEPSRAFTDVSVPATRLRHLFATSVEERAGQCVTWHREYSAT
jgi:hypothetical protein